jgi:glycosyltransferase involved in cell wall biosynthesis
MPIHINDAHERSIFARIQTGLLFNLPVPGPDDEQLPEGISLCMIVKNEERFLAECLESVKDVVDEINIIDTGSTDRTVEIARSYGANVDFREWRGDFAWARNEVIAMATRRWTLVLDADEELERESRSLVNSLRTTPATMTSVYINIINLINDPTGMGTMSHRLIRIFPTGQKLRYKGVIHETIGMQNGEPTSAVLSPITILHKGYTAEMLTERDKDSRNKPLVSRAYEENGDDSFSLFNFGNSAMCSGDIDLGIEVLERMLATATETKLYFPLAHLMLCQGYCEYKGELEKALDIVEKGIEKFPNDAGLIFCKGQVLIKLDRTEEAREMFEEAMDLRERMAYSVMTDEEIFEWKIYYATAGSYEREKRFDKSLEYINMALSNKPNAYSLQHARAVVLERLGNFYEAEVAFRQIAELDTQRGLLEHVNFLLRRSRYPEAIALVEHLVDSSVINPALVARLNVAAARALIDSKRGDPMPYLESALRLAPGNGFAISLAERVLTERGDDAALQKLHAEELLAPCVRPEDYTRRSARLLALQRNDEARVAADAGLQIEQANPELRFNSAIASLNLGDEERALQDLSRVEPSAPEVYVEAARVRAALMLKAGDAQAAVKVLERFVDARSQDVESVLMAAGMLVAGGARPQARQLLEAHVGAGARIAVELAGMLLQDGDIAGAGRVAAASLT